MKAKDFMSDGRSESCEHGFEALGTICSECCADDRREIGRLKAEVVGISRELETMTAERDHARKMWGDTIDARKRDQQAADLQNEALTQKLAGEKDLCIRSIECAARIGHAMEDCLAAMGRAYDKLEWMKGPDVTDCQSQIKAAGERGRVALQGVAVKPKPPTRPDYLCASRINEIFCDLSNAHEGLHCKFGQLAETQIWWVIGDSTKVAKAALSHLAPRDTEKRVDAQEPKAEPWYCNVCERHVTRVPHCH